MSYRVRNLIIATLLALLAGLLTTIYVSSYKRRVQQGEDLVPVLVAKRDIDVGSSGSGVRGAVGVRKIARRNLAPGAVGDVRKLGALVAAQPIYAGEQITTRRFSRAETLGPRGALRGTMRLVALPGGANQLLAGVLKAGDRVDVIAALPGGGDSAVKPTQILLRDVLVVRPAAKPDIDSEGALNEPALSVLVALAETDAQKLFFAAKNGEWTLALRPTDGSLR